MRRKSGPSPSFGRLPCSTPTKWTGAGRWQVQDEPVNNDFVDFEPARAGHRGDRGPTFATAAIGLSTEGRTTGSEGDFIQLPFKHQFEVEKEYYSTALHELGHWSEIRLGWTGSYALGELRSEISSAYSLAELGVPQSDDLTNCQSYLSWWGRRIEGRPPLASCGSRPPHHGPPTIFCHTLVHEKRPRSPKRPLVG